MSLFSVKYMCMNTLRFLIGCSNTGRKFLYSSLSTGTVLYVAELPEGTLDLLVLRPFEHSSD